LYRTYKQNHKDGIRRDLIEYNAEDIVHTQLILNGLRDMMKGL
jgi:uncharacterized protein YprB with RNaseH-like and TPR domain